ncbi:glycosyltransferase family 2 protein [Chryseobacterium oryzae]|uniref:Glycosyltransferase n=1 Tax=Chryseobacterium oryzae TaxID=2929799 RepID=A0ABY4BFR0_9FLAO|nr:glycosyltransferase family 2 protein [Chryseobacterium oryzae]UOE38003.1 glycosyltransferase [Chryseobacterium oryzae]
MKISIITINYNNIEGLQKTFSSIFSQILEDFEYIVIDGGSSDGSKEIIEKNSEKISYYVSEPDGGIYNAMNKGIKAANGEYLLFINSGDELYSEQSLELAKPHLHTDDIISGNLIFSSDNQDNLGISKPEVTFLQFYNDTIWHPCTFIKKSAFAETDYYDENFKICSDWKWFLLAVYKYGKTYRKIDITISRFYLDGVSSNTQNQDTIKKERRETLEKYFFFKEQDFNTFNKLLGDQSKLRDYSNKISLIKRSRILKLLSHFGLFKLYKYL